MEGIGSIFAADAIKLAHVVFFNNRVKSAIQSMWCKIYVFSSYAMQLNLNWALSRFADK